VGMIGMVRAEVKEMLIRIGMRLNMVTFLYSRICMFV
jgi:hypothetical protein